MKKIRIEYGTLDEDTLEICYLTPQQVVEAFVEEFSDREKTAEEIVVDIFRGIYNEVEDWELELVESAVRKLKKRGNYDIASLVEKVLAPANKLAQDGKEVLKKYCQDLDT